MTSADTSHKAEATQDGEQVGGSAETLESDHALTLASREKLVAVREEVVLAREDATQAREGESNLREDAATKREADIRTVEAALVSGPPDHVEMLQQANANLVIAAIEAHKLTEQVESSKIELDHLAHHDGLTDLPNRMLLHDRLGQAIEGARRQGRRFAVLFMDLDRFKHINDSLGHGVGDQLLKSVAQRLVECIRQSDTVSRQWGDEFILLLPEIEHAEDAAQSAQKILAALALPHPIGNQNLYISVSIGISVYTDDGENVEALLQSADTAMYHAKESGRNNFKFFEQDMNARAVERQSIEADLRLALDRQEFVLHYQPKIDLASGTIVGVEALIRWQHPQRGLLQPLEFVSVAEDCGLIRPIGRWVLRQACLQAQAWLQAGFSPITMAVNTSALEFRAGDYLQNLRATLAQTRLDPSLLEIELTESVLIRDAEASETLLHEIAQLGVRLAIDDFGTGYSSLSYLKKFPINTLKIDQAFVTQMSSNPDDASIVQAVISMGKSLRMRVIAEGVESAAQCHSLLALQCDEGQGFYFGRPVSAEAMASVLRTGISMPCPVDNLLRTDG